jgi:MSHA pilin protein MshD
MFSSSAARQRGVTLIELILFIVIVSVAVVGVLGVLSLTTRKSADPLRHKQALMIAQGLLEEVELAKFTYCDPDPSNSASNADTAGATSDCTLPEAFGPEAGNARPFDNINDYVPEAGKAAAAFDVGGLLSDANGNAIDVQGYSASLTIAPAQLGPATAPIGDTGTSADTKILRITVTVTYDGGQQVVLDGYRARYAPNAL